MKLRFWIALIMSWTWIDLTRMARITSQEEQEVLSSTPLGERKRQTRRRSRSSPKWKKPPERLYRAPKLKGSAPKDVRFADQRKLRRMYRNC